MSKSLKTDPVSELTMAESEGPVVKLFQEVVNMDETTLKTFLTGLSKEDIHLTGQKPPKMNPNKTRSLFLAQREKTKQHFYGSESMSVPFSTKPLKNLQRIRIQDMIVGKQAEGAYLMLRILEPPIECAGIMTVVEDHTGDVFILNLGLYIHAEYKTSIREEIAVGTVFALKEPVLRNSLGENMVIFSSSSADLIHINRYHVLWESAKQICWVNSVKEQRDLIPEGLSSLELKNIGNQLYKSGKRMKAIEAYKIALNSCTDPELEITLHLNLAAAYLVTEYYELTIKQTDMVLEIKADNLKALYRAGRAHYQLKQYGQSKSRFEKFLLLDPTNLDVALQIVHCNTRLEEETGKIDTKKLCFTAMENPFIKVECGEYVGPVELLPIAGKGVGVVASRDIAPGTMLTVSKAFQLESYDSKTCPPHAALKVTKIFLETVQAVFRNPKTFGKCFYKLSTNDPERDKDYQPYCDEESEQEPIIDLLRVMLIIRTNHFCLSSVVPAVFPTGDKPFSSAIFEFPSYFNHSCLSNSNCQIYNDVLVIRSNTFIHKGEELTISYIWENGYLLGLQGFISREQFFSSRGFQCHCLLCELERAQTLEIHRRREYLGKLSITLPLCQRTAEKYDWFIKQMEHSYGHRTKLRVQLSMFLMAFAFSHSADDSLIIMEYVNQALNCIGLSSDILLKCAEDDKVFLPKNAVICYDYLVYIIIFPVLNVWYVTENVQEKEKWLGVLYMLERVLQGGDLSTLKAKTKSNDLFNFLLP